MYRAIASVIIGVGLLSGTVVAQTPQTVDVAKIDVQKLAAGYRASKIIGLSVSNDTNDTIGKIDDLLVSPDGQQPFIVLSVGGFLGMGNRLVVVPYSSVNFAADNKTVLPGVTKDSLMMLPEFKYATQ